MDDETSWTAAGGNSQGQGYIIGSDATNARAANQTPAGGGIIVFANVVLANFGATAGVTTGGAQTLNGDDGHYIEMMYVMRRP
ncbi:MAG: hypothetical protein Rsou_0510 [Candidatus Ruthia sp. Asou_11_S2]|nr:hypothetical protein [Candidatus Ruthia sp. Asou_11_S2]